MSRRPGGLLTLALALIWGAVPVVSLGQTPHGAPVAKAHQSASPKSAKPPAARSAPEAVGEVTVRDETFHSASVARDMKYRVILPVGYANSPRHYAVLYLLHGAWGDYTDWETKSYIADQMRTLPMVVVMPDGGDTWYTNSATVPQDRFEDYIAKDLVKDVEGKYRVIRERLGRVIAGLSMGGYGTMKFALKYPQMFAMAVSFSGAFSIPGDIESPRHDNGDYRERVLLKVFGPPGDPARTANDLFAIAAKADPKTLPYIWIDCGTADFLLQANRDFVKLLKERGIAYEYHETPGAHTWQFWDDGLRAVLPVITERLKVQPRNAPAATGR